MDYKGTKKVLILLLIVTGRFILNCRSQKICPIRKLNIV